MHRPEFEKVLTATVPSLLMLYEDCVGFMLSLQDLDRQNHGAIAFIWQKLAVSLDCGVTTHVLSNGRATLFP